jgi:hypothetical protein
MAVAFLSGLNGNYHDISHFANWHDSGRYKKQEYICIREADRFRRLRWGSGCAASQVSAFIIHSRI